MAPRRRPPRPGALTELAPLRILTQIIALQVSYYGVAIVLILFSAIIAGLRPHAGLLFDWRLVRGDVTTGWTLALCWMLDALITVIPILLLIARSKLVPDFALTIHFINLIVTSAYTRQLPLNLYWWLTQASSAALMIALGMWACRWRELKPMSFGGTAKVKEVANTEPAELEEGEGYAMGRRGRGRGRDGAGTYEMVGMGGTGEGT